MSGFGRRKLVKSFQGLNLYVYMLFIRLGVIESSLLFSVYLHLLFHSIIYLLLNLFTHIFIIDVITPHFPIYSFNLSPIAIRVSLYIFIRFPPHLLNPLLSPPPLAQVTGYVLISHVDVKKIVLPSLQIVRGQMLFKLSVHDQSFALLVTLSKMHTLEMPALRGEAAGLLFLFFFIYVCLFVFSFSEVFSSRSFFIGFMIS